MNKGYVPDQVSFLVATPRNWHKRKVITSSENPLILITASVQSENKAFFFRDLQMGTILGIYSNNTFSLQDPAGYNSGIIFARQMRFEGYDISVWHQDDRFSFTCQANHVTGFCFGWFIDRTYGKSCRILDPGKTA
jgi:hypothetical protein